MFERGNSEGEDEDDEEMVKVAMPEQGRQAELEQIPLGTILQIETHSGKEHPQWPGGRLVIDCKDCREIQIVFSTHRGLCAIQRHIQKHVFDPGPNATFAIAFGASS